MTRNSDGSGNLENPKWKPQPYWSPQNRPEPRKTTNPTITTKTKKTDFFKSLIFPKNGRVITQNLKKPKIVTQNDQSENQEECTQIRTRPENQSCYPKSSLMRQRIPPEKKSHAYAIKKPLHLELMPSSTTLVRYDARARKWSVVRLAFWLISSEWFFLRNNINLSRGKENGLNHREEV